MKKLIFPLLTACCVMFFSNTFSQNLVPNGNFENYSSLPNSMMDWNYCVGWNNVNGSSSSWPYATPDYYHTAGTGDAQLPNCKIATVSPHGGDGIIGLYSKHSSQSNARDYMATQLSSPLTVGTSYTISFWMTNGSPSYYYGSSCNHMGIQLSMAPLSQTQHENIGGTPQADITTEVWSSSWVFYSFTYVATSAYQYMTIGNFHTDAATATTVRSGANYTGGVYYFIDDIIIEPTTPLPIELISFDAIHKGELVNLEWITKTEINNNFFTVERSINTENWEEIGQVAGAGNSTNVLNYILQDDNPHRGVSYYRLKQTDFDGKFTYSSVRTVYINGGNEIQVYPNPATDFITLQGDVDEISSFRLYNTVGQEVNYLVNVKEGFDENTLIINVSNLAKGMYILKTSNSFTKLYKE